jgi:hypothetical protein
VQSLWEEGLAGTSVVAQSPKGPVKFWKVMKGFLTADKGGIITTIFSSGLWHFTTHWFMCLTRCISSWSDSSKTQDLSFIFCQYSLKHTMYIVICVLHHLAEN